MSSLAEGLVERLISRAPGLRPRYAATVAECVAEGLIDGAPEIFLEEYSRSVLDGFRADPGTARAPLGELAGALEAEYGTDGDLDTLIDFAFLALFPDAADPDPALILGPKLSAAVAGARSWRARPEDREFVARLIAAVPVLASLAQENAYGDHAEVLVHPFLGDVARREVDNFGAGRLDEVRTVLALLETEWGRDVDEPIAVSFVEQLPYPTEVGAGLVELLGPRLRAELDRQRSSRGEPSEAAPQ